MVQLVTVANGWKGDGYFTLVTEDIPHCCRYLPLMKCYVLAGRAIRSSSNFLPTHLQTFECATYLSEIHFYEGLHNSPSSVILFKTLQLSLMMQVNLRQLRIPNSVGFKPKIDTKLYKGREGQQRGNRALEPFRR